MSCAAYTGKEEEEDVSAGLELWIQLMTVGAVMNWQPAFVLAKAGLERFERSWLGSASGFFDCVKHDSGLLHFARNDDLAFSLADGG